MEERSSEVDVGKRRDDALRRALNTRPQPKPTGKTKDREPPADAATAQTSEPPAGAS
jgi:hypothetical protein